MGLGITGSSWAQNPELKTNLPPSTSIGTEIIVLGALHDYHQKNPVYTKQILRDIMIACAPQAILVELTATEHGKPTVKEGRIVEEYTRLQEMWSCQQAAQRLNVPIHPFDMDRLAEFRQETRYWQRRQQAEKDAAALLVAYPEDQLVELRAKQRFSEDLQRAIITFAEKGNPEVINSEAFDSMVRGGKHWQVVADKAYERLFQVHPEKSTLWQELRLIRQEWQQRNEAMADKIEGYAKQYAGKRLVTVVGAEHRYLLRDLLRNRKGLTLKEYWELR